ncbi:MAG: hydroxymethylbilane synthase, partial [Blastocatellia bacterium]
LPTEITAGLHVGAVSEREDVRDALVARGGITSFDSLPKGARVGTSSLRRQSQIRAVRSDLMMEPVRGNVDTRLRKVEGGGFDAVILASAGLRRLGHADRITEYLDESLVLPAVGQGALGIQTRADDKAINEIVKGLDHAATHAECAAERAFLAGLGGGCIVPIAALAKINGDDLHLRGLVASPDGAESIRGEGTGPARAPEALGRKLADELISRGADRLLSV